MPKSKNHSEEEKTLTSVLSLCGLSEKESQMYWILLDKGTMTGAEIVTESGYKKGNTYALLHQLTKKGLVLALKKDEKTYFQPQSPQKIYDLLERKTEEAKQAKQYFEHVLTDLSTRYKNAVDRPVVRYLEGEKGIREVFHGVYHSFNKVVYGCVDPRMAPPELWAHVLKDLMPLRIKNGVQALTFHPEKVNTPQIKQEPQNLKTVIDVDESKYPMPCEIDNWDDKTSFISFKKGELVGIVIENEDIAKTISSLFRLSFDLLLEKKCRLSSDRSQANGE